MMDQYIVVFVRDSIIESRESTPGGIYVVVDTGGETTSKPVVARCADANGAIAVAAALNEGVA
jgi:hypothetical protein